MGEFSDLPDLQLQGNGDALIGGGRAGEPEHRRGAADRQRGRDAVGRRRAGGARGLVRRRAAGPGDRVAALRRHAPTGKLPMTFPVSLADMPDQHARAVPRASSRRLDDASGGVDRDPPGGLHRGPAGRLQVVPGSRASIRSSPSATASRTRRSSTTRCRSRRSRRTARRRSGSRSGSPTRGSGPARRPRRRTSSCPIRPASRARDSSDGRHVSLAARASTPT